MTAQISLKKAEELLRRPGHRLMMMHTANNGQAYFVVPGGRLKHRDAQKILQRPDCIAYDDGLFPGIPQSWTLGERR